MSKYTPYIIKPDTPLFKAAIDFEQRLRDTSQALDDEVTKHNGHGYCIKGNRLNCILFREGQPTPEGWTRERGVDDYRHGETLYGYRLKGSTKAAREIRERWNTFECLNWVDFGEKAINLHPINFMQGLTINKVFKQTLGDRVILFIPKLENANRSVDSAWSKLDFSRKQMVQIKLSEYHAMCEDAEIQPFI